MPAVDEPQEEDILCCAGGKIDIARINKEFGIAKREYSYNDCTPPTDSKAELVMEDDDSNLFSIIKCYMPGFSTKKHYKISAAASERRYEQFENAIKGKEDGKSAAPKSSSNHSISQNGKVTDQFPDNMDMCQQIKDALPFDTCSHCIQQVSLLFFFLLPYTLVLRFGRV